MQFRWIDWNRVHVLEHGVDPEEAERVVRQARPPFPQQIGDDKLLVMGRGRGDRLLQVIYLFDLDNTVFIIHARPLNEHEKRRYRRKTQE